MGDHHPQGEQIEQGSPVVLEVENSGGQDIEESHWAVPVYVTFPGRTVKHFKVRDAGDLYELIHPDERPLPEADASRIALPALPLNRRATFKLLVLLTGSGSTVEAGGILRSGRITRTKTSRRGRLLTGIVVGALVVGTVGGVWLANGALDPAPVCTSGSLTVEGSTAFAPIATEVKNAYEQSCPNASIAILADGSRVGVDHLGTSRPTSPPTTSNCSPATP